jgi:hypothetical protein
VLRTLEAINKAVERSSLTADDVCRESLLATMYFAEPTMGVSPPGYTPMQCVSQRALGTNLIQASLGVGILQNTPSLAHANIMRLIPTRQVQTSYDLMQFTAPQVESPDTQETPEEREIRKSLMEPLGSNARERYAFSTLVDYVEMHGERALRVLQDVAFLPATPSTSKYYIALILGYIENTAVRDICRNLLSALMQNSDPSLRTGAEDGFAYLQS